MPQQAITFCTAADGVRIACASIGAGPPLLYVTGWPAHLEVEWSKPFVREFLEELGRGVRLIRYDMRGSGLSDREVEDVSLSALLQDLAAVADHLRLERFALLSLGDVAGPLALAFAARNPGRVTHLILNSAYARGCDIATPERQEATINYVANFGFPIFDFADAPLLDVEKQRALREIEEAGASHAVQASLLRTMYSVDVTGDLGQLTLPILIMHARDDSLVPFTAGRDLALRLPHAKFVPYEGSSASPWVHRHVLFPEIRIFLSLDRRPAADDEASHRLTQREVEILRLVADGLNSRQIGALLTLSTRTVERHMTNVFAKIHVGTRAQAIAYALKHGLISEP